MKIRARVRIRAPLGTGRRNEARCTISRRYRRNSVLVVEKRQAEAQDLIPRLQRANIEFERSSFVVLSRADRRASRRAKELRSPLTPATGTKRPPNFLVA
jgi:hypothetical protein